METSPGRQVGKVWYGMVGNDLPFEFKGEVSSAGAVAEAGDVKSSP